MVASTASRGGRAGEAYEFGTARNYVGGEWVELDSAGGLARRDQPGHRGPGDRSRPARDPGRRRPGRAGRPGGVPGLAGNSADAARSSMFKLKEVMEGRLEELARVITREHGKTLDDARGEVRRAVENVETAGGIPTLMMGYGLEDGAAGHRRGGHPQPLGVFAAVWPFNFPDMVPFWFWPSRSPAATPTSSSPARRCRCR